MPALPSVPKVIKLAMVYSDGVNLDIVTRMHLAYSGSAPSNADLDTFATDVSTAEVGDLAPLRGGEMFAIRVDATDLSSPTGAVGTVGVSNAGTRAGNPVPVQIAFVTSYVIGRRYRGGHPRGYWPFGVSVDLNTLQTWQGAFASEVGGALTSFRTAVRAAVWGSGGSLGFVNVSYYQGFTVVTNPITGRARNVPTVRGTPVVDAVETFIPRIKVGTQRRRAQY